MTVACKHRWRLSGWTGRITARGLVSIDYCTGCKAERRRKATATELAARKAYERDTEEVHKLGREWYRRVGAKRGYDAIEAMEKFAKDHPKSVAVASVDDYHFSSSVIGFWLNQSKKSLFCVTGVYLPQHSSGDPEPSVAPRYFHLYPGDLESLYEAVSQIRKWTHKRKDWREARPEEALMGKTKKVDDHGKLRVKSEKLRVKVWPVLEEAVEDGVRLGWSRAHKHVEAPDEDALRQQLVDSVMASISEKFYIEEKD